MCNVKRILPACTKQEIVADGKNVVPDVWDVLDKIKNFSDKVRLQACSIDWAVLSFTLDHLQHSSGKKWKRPYQLCATLATPLWYSVDAS